MRALNLMWLNIGPYSYAALPACGQTPEPHKDERSGNEGARAVRPWRNLSITQEIWLPQRATSPRMRFVCSPEVTIDLVRGRAETQRGRKTDRTGGGKNSPPPDGAKGTVCGDLVVLRTRSHPTQF